MQSATRHTNRPASFSVHLAKLPLFTLTAGCLLGLAGAAHAQTYSASGPGGAIPDGSGSNVPGVPLVSTAFIANSGIINDVTVDFSNLNHTYVGDLTITLTHPNGFTSINIISRPGRGTGNDFGYGSNFLAANSYSFSDAGAVLFDVNPGTNVASGTYIPSSNPNLPGAATNSLVPYTYTPTSLATTFAGLDSAGNWTLTITDWAGADTGSLEGWTVNVNVPEPSTYALLLTAGLGAICFVRRRRK